ncbi:HPr kinase/phosphorylase [Brevundimonas vesicularis]|uniref:HPr kinase/phosphorylase n=1 Tax=Brevundimonas vesicularis TaxID=41276 RepID=UPI0038D45AA9
MNRIQPLHATTLARLGPDGWRGVLIQGPSGVGKSDLALRLMACGWSLVADDWTLVWASAGHLYAAPPPSIAGRMEVRGVGVMTLPASQPIRPLARLSLAVTATQDPIERLPEPALWRHQGVAITHLKLDPRPASANLALAAAFAAL